MLNLRLKEGINFQKYHERFGYKFLERFKKEVEKQIKLGNIELTDSNIFIKEEKLFISNLIISDLLEKIEY